MVEQYKNVLIIGAEVQPIPPVKGGAVEQLINDIVKDNENNQYMNLTIVSPYDMKAIVASKEYLHTNFIFIKDFNNLLGKIYCFVDLFLRKFFNKTSGILYIHKIVKSIDLNKYDLIIVENRPLFGKIIRHKYHGKLILHLHNDFVNKTTKLLPEILPYYDEYLTVSNFLKNQLSLACEKKITVIHNGIDVKSFNNDVDITNNKSIIYVGRLVKEKGILELIKAFNNINDEELRLIIVGDFDNSFGNQRAFINEFNLLTKDNKNIEIVGYIKNNELKNYYVKASIGVVPSIVEEAFGLSALEMMATGLPVVASDAGGLKEVGDVDCCIIVKRDDLVNNLEFAIKKLIKNKESLRPMSINAQKRAKLFDKEIYLKNMKEYIAGELHD